MTLSPKNLIIFDLDGTLAQSKLPLDAEMARLLCDLMGRAKVAVISGASFGQFEKQFLGHLTCPDNSRLANLSILPTNGSAFYSYSPDKKGETGPWQLVYRRSLLPEEKKRIMDSIMKVIAQPENAEFFKGQKIYGKQVEDRESQIAFSGVGQDAPISAKKVWDPDHARRDMLAAQLQPSLPEFQINIGGMTTIDITRKGVDKEYGINMLADHFSIPKADIMYVGDALFPGGNDYPAIASGVPVHAVKNVSETKDFIRKLLSNV